MVDAGLTGVNLSLDTLDPMQFQIMTRRRGFEGVMKSLERVLEMKRQKELNRVRGEEQTSGLRVKINCVVMQGVNEDQILPFVELTRDKDIEVRFIEYMPFSGNRWKRGKMVTFEEMLRRIRERYPDIYPLRYSESTSVIDAKNRHAAHKNDTSRSYHIPGFVGRVGFITSMTHNFCSSCNRLRITSDGNLKVCLFGNDEVSLRDILRKYDFDGTHEGGTVTDTVDHADHGSRTATGMNVEMFEKVQNATTRASADFERHEDNGVSGRNVKREEMDRELLDVIGRAVGRKKERHAGMTALETMENRPMILIGG